MPSSNERLLSLKAEMKSAMNSLELHEANITASIEYEEDAEHLEMVGDYAQAREKARLHKDARGNARTYLQGAVSHLEKARLLAGVYDSLM